MLIGLPGCGKSAAGRLAARLLGAPFADLDEMISHAAGRPVSRIFAEEGEARFRQLEREAMARALAGPAAVIAPGGGWAAQPGNLELAADAALLIYLRVTPASAADRIGDVSSRPLLAGAAPAVRLTELLEDREPYYRRAGHSIDTDGRPLDHVSHAIVRLARTHAGWGVDRIVS